ncbi:DUF1513 domain-containing protein [Marinomonas transparens]|uniref:DUF1513 domain-containing protein n=1 Tax=Marinomonas transparens TaxID=2795388 RepID=A0A934JPV5_9GAMM|nr:DUF1513 domain-containing protein [Marinomonas transparens]MBJ7537588.1 DUF1513 domain-containing protein [Marinomonas transparens]
MLTRRSFLALGGMVATAPSWGALLSTNTDNQVYGSAFSKSKQEHFFGLFNEQGDILWTMPLAARAHAPVVHPHDAIVGIVARRPGFFIDFFDASSHQLIKQIKPTKEHHFYGHALFTQDGAHLITQENHYPSGQGKIFVRQWPSGEVLHVFNSNGIGPHESVFLNDQVLVIANGGLMTRPDADRKILNLDTMQPNVTYLSLVDGHVIHSVKHDDALHQLSIRHLDVNPQGVVALGFQYQGELWEQVPLIGLSSIHNDSIDYLTMPEAIRTRFKQYCGSVCFDSSGEILAISTPRGGLVAYWHIASKQFLGVDNCRDVCGLVATGRAHEFFVTNGLGAQLKTNPVQNTIALVKTHAGYHWDNHFRVVNS